MKHVRILATGGTFEKYYDEIKGKLTFAQSYLPQILSRARVTLPIEVQTVSMLDSLEMTEVDRERILLACRDAREELIVIVHGTDTMCDTARLLGEQQLSKTIVLTGAMIPYAVINSDALFNLGMALGVAQTLPPDVYIAMNGQIFNWKRVKKDRRVGVFIEHDGC